MTGGPLCFGQLSIWRSIKTNPLVRTTAAQLTTLRRLPSGMTEQQVYAALRTLWLRHEGLRTTFEEVGDQARQVVHQAPDDVMEVCRLESADELMPCAEDLFARVFVLTRGFAWRVRLMQLPDGSSSLAVSTHHILADRWAFRLLREEFGQILCTPATALARPTVTPTELAHQQQSDEWATRRTATLAHLQRVEDFVGGSTPNLSDQRLRGLLDLATFSGVVVDLTRRHRVSAQTVVLTLFALGVRATTGRARIAVHLMAANRHRREWHSLVTSMNQMAPAGIDTERAGTIGGLFHHVHATTMATMRNACFDVDEAAAATGRPPGSTVDFVLNYMVENWPTGSPIDARRPADRPLVTVGPSTRPAIAGIYGLVAHRETLELDLHVDAGQYPEGRLRRFLDGVAGALRLLAERPDAPVDDIAAQY